MQDPANELKWWVEIQLSAEILAELNRLIPDLEVISINGQSHIAADAMVISGRKGARREEVRRFETFLRGVLLFEGVAAAGLTAPGNLVGVSADGRRHFVMLADPVQLSISINPVVLSAAGSTKNANRRPFPARLAELIARDEHFARAIRRMENAGTDLREIFKAMEAIERGNGGFPMDDTTKSAQTRAKRNAARAEFCEKIGVSESAWSALLRSCRPHRHEYVHDDGGPTHPASLVRQSVTHILKAWVERDVPV